jgi:hypothetical protein
MKKDLKIFFGIFLALAASRFIPHPPNFTSLIALSFYVPAIFGKRYLPALIVSFVITDLIIGFHGTVLFTWGSVLIIGLLANNFSNSLIKRISGCLLGACLFFIVTNFGVWTLGSYGYSINGLFTSYFMAIPFFGYSLISTLVFAFLIEASCQLCIKRFNLNILKN